MSSSVNVRVELKKKYSDPKRNFNEMFQDFRKKINASGIMHEYKEHQYFESRSEKKRKKKKDAKKKQQMESLEMKILSGERVKAPSGIVKKILNTDQKNRRPKR